MPSLGCLPNISSAVRVLVNSWLAEANVKKVHAELNVKHLCISRVLTAPPQCTPFSHRAEYIRESFSCLNGTWDPIRTTWEPDFEEYHPNSYRFLFKDAISAYFRLVLLCIAHIPRPTSLKSAFTVMSFEQGDVKVKRQKIKAKKRSAWASVWGRYGYCLNAKTTGWTTPAAMKIYSLCSVLIRD